jgi:hypothetical protein
MLARDLHKKNQHLHSRAQLLQATYSYRASTHPKWSVFYIIGNTEKFPDIEKELPE